MVSNSMSKLEKRKNLRNTFGLTISEAKSFETIVDLTDSPTIPVTVTASYIAEIIESSHPTANNNIKKLVKLGLINAGRVKYQYFIKPEAFNFLKNK